MSIKILDTPHYIYIEASEGLAYWDIFEGFTSMMRETNKAKHAFWHIQKGPTNFSVSDFNSIMKMIQDRYVLIGDHQKIAFVIDSELHYDIMTAFIEVTKKVFGSSLKTFREFRPAQQWVIKD